MFSNPLQNIKSFGLSPDNIVADLGAGTGYYAVAAGSLVPQGKVYAVEISKDYLDIIRSRIKESNLHNVEVIWGNVEQKGGTKLKDGLADAVIASNILFQTEDKEGFLEEARRILKPGGKVLFVDWTESFILRGGKPIQKEKARALFEKHGFIFSRDIDAGEHHYGMIFKKGE